MTSTCCSYVKHSLKELGSKTDSGKTISGKTIKQQSKTISGKVTVTCIQLYIYRPAAMLYTGVSLELQYSQTLSNARALEAFLPAAETRHQSQAIETQQVETM